MQTVFIIRRIIFNGNCVAINYAVGNKKTYTTLISYGQTKISCAMFHGRFLMVTFQQIMTEEKSICERESEAD